jgi:hypothetical protein
MDEALNELRARRGEDGAKGLALFLQWFITITSTIAMIVSIFMVIFVIFVIWEFLDSGLQALNSIMRW